MGKLHLFGKAKRGAKKFSGLFTKSKHRTTRLPHSRRASKNKYPIIKKLKLSDCVPSTALGRLEQYAKDAKHNGAVQTIHLPNSSTLAYPVIVMNEDDMKQAGMTPKNGDLGYLSSSLSKDYIQPATLHADIQRGYLAIIPSDKSIQNLDTFDSLNKIKFHWGLFLNTFKDGSDSNQVIVLDNTVTLSELINYSKGQPKMVLSGRKLVVDGKSALNHINEPLQTDYSQTGRNHASASSNLQQGTNTNNENYAGNYEIHNTDQNSAANNSRDTRINQVPQGPTPNNPRAMQQSNSSTDNTSETGTQNLQSSEYTNPQQSQSESYNYTPATSKNDVKDSYNNSSNDTQNQDTSDAIVQNDTNDPDLLKYEQEAGNVDSSDDIGSRTEKNNDPTEPQQSPQDYAKGLKKFMSDTYYDNNLHIKLNLSDIKQILMSHKAPQLALLNIKKGDKVGHLKHLINIRIIERNKQLRQLHANHNAQIMDSARNLLSKTSGQLNNILSPDNKASKVHKRYLKIKKAYKQAKATQSATASTVNSSADVAYKSLKSQYTDAKASNAAAEFDQMHRRAHDAERNRTEERIKEIGKKDHISQVDSLNKWRQGLAKKFLTEALSDIKTDASNKRDKAYQDEKYICDSNSHKVHRELGRYYKDELRRVNRINYNNKHDHKIKHLRKNNADTIKRYKVIIDNLKNDAHQDKINTLKDQRDRMQAIIKNNQLLQSQLSQLMKYARRAGNTLPPKYERELKFENARVREIQRRNYNDRKRYNQDLDSMSKAFRRRTSSIDQFKSRFIWYGTGGGVLLAIMVLIGGIAIGHLTSSPQTHYVREEVPSKGRGGNTTINNGNNQAPSSSKSSAYVNKHGHRVDVGKGPHVVNRSLMTKRPPDRSGLYIGTSTSHTPTSFMYVKHYHMYNKGMTVIGYKNNSEMHLKVSRVYKNMIFVVDPSNNVHYEFNVY